eukprot:NODE_4457_length_799_cov_5.458667_g3701_i0.p6 GENE.NODE_4457_length_799_cov_5.458667_g3701_i0~~NODE_4457_length_799_cov_5.458667_g3701_i0.p6  ORF type:complete len:50 (-),score=2.22 NODE_4457_length_799_cov_5.458667_g3701_i0:91-240(-)
MAKMAIFGPAGFSARKSPQAVTILGKISDFAEPGSPSHMALRAISTAVD